MNDTDIEYLKKTWNPVVGCTNGCPWCWARRQAKRQKHNCRRCYAFKPHLHPERLDEPLRTREPSVIGVAFMGDLFDPEINGEMLARCFEVMQACPRHTFVVLTKQAKRMRAECETLFENWFVRFPDGILPNLVLGVSVEDQESADRLIPELMECPAATRIVSIEPMQGAVKLRHDWLGYTGTTGKFRTNEGTGKRQVAFRLSPTAPRLDGVILGGQTGPDAVAMNPEWVRKVRDQCAGAGVPFFFKQWGEWVPSPMVGRRGVGPRGVPLDIPDNGVWAWPWATEDRSGIHGDTTMMVRVGRKAAGRMLDERTHDEVAWTTAIRFTAEAQRTQRETE